VLAAREYCDVHSTSLTEDRKIVILTDKSTRVREVICSPDHIYRC
jgi:hypothetical protein